MNVKEQKEAFQRRLAYIVAIGFFAILIVLIIQGKYPDTVTLIIGSLIGSYTIVIGYFFGSSKGSADKGEAIQKLPAVPSPDSKTTQTTETTIETPAP